jgi:hypothetical protein
VAAAVVTVAEWEFQRVAFHTVPPVIVAPEIVPFEIVAPVIVGKLTVAPEAFTAPVRVGPEMVEALILSMSCS